MVSGETAPSPAAFRPRALRSRAAHAPLAREPHGSLDGRELAQRRAAATCRLHRTFSSCPFSPPLLAAPAYSGRRRPDRMPPGRPRRRRLTLALPLLLPGLRPPRAFRLRFGLPSSPSSPPRRCPGSGLQRSRLLPASKPTRRLSDREGPRRLRIRPAVAILPPPPRQPAGVPSAETRPSPPSQRQPRAQNRVAWEGELLESFRGAQVTTGVRGRRFPDRHQTMPSERSAPNRRVSGLTGCGDDRPSHVAPATQVRSRDPASPVGGLSTIPPPIRQAEWPAGHSGRTRYSGWFACPGLGHASRRRSQSQQVMHPT